MPQENGVAMLQQDHNVHAHNNVSLKSWSLSLNNTHDLPSPTSIRLSSYSTQPTPGTQSTVSDSIGKDTLVLCHASTYLQVFDDPEIANNRIE